MHECGCVHISAMPTIRESAVSLRGKGTGSCEILDMDALTQNSHSVQEQHKLLTTERSLQPFIPDS